MKVFFRHVLFSAAYLSFHNTSFAQALVFQHQEYEAPSEAQAAPQIPIEQKIALAEKSVQSLRPQVAQNLSKTEQACANPTSISCVNQKRSAAQIEGALMGSEAALRELRTNNLNESDESLQRRADIDQLHLHVERMCRSPETFKICEESSTRLEESTAWMSHYYKLKWNE